MRADVIHVIQEGQIVESGTHHDLLAQDGLYSRSWMTQMRAASGSIAEAQPNTSEPFKNLAFR